jgi:cobalt/nickel transport protein
MKTTNRNLFIGVIVLCLVIGVLAPFITSSNPDGLEKSTEQIMGTTESEPVIQSPFLDYTIEPFGKAGEVIAMVLGIIITLIIAYLMALLLKRRRGNLDE